MKKEENGKVSIYPFKHYEKEGNKITKYIYANGNLVATIETDNGVKYIHTDHLNSTSVITNNQGFVTGVLDYYPYGQKRIDTGVNNSNKQFIGQYFDGDTELNYLNARYYDGENGRFISEDPVFWEVGQTEDGKKILTNPQLQNSYGYTGNNPVTYKDPEGRCPLCIVVVGSVAMYAPQVTSFAQSLLTPLGQYGLTEVVQNAQKGNYGMAVFGVITGGEIPGTNAVKGLKIPEGLSLGQDFGKLGKVIENTPGQIDNLSDHALRRFFQRTDLKFKDIAEAVKNPVVTLEQSDNKVARLTKNAFVVIDKSVNQVVTWYSKTEFKNGIKNILNKIKDVK